MGRHVIKPYNKSMTELEKILLAEIEKIKAVILKKVPDSDIASDVLQDSLFKALSSADTLKDTDRLLPWFYRLLNNTIVDIYRKKNADNIGIQKLKSEDHLFHNEDEISDICGCLSNLIPALKPEYKEIIQMLDIDEFTTSETAEKLGITLNNLKVKRHRARKQLKKRLEDTCKICATHGCLDCTCTT